MGRWLLGFLLFSLATGGLVTASVQWLPELIYFPRLSIDAGDQLNLDLFLAGDLREASCNDRVEKYRQSIGGACATCKPIVATCRRGIDRRHRAALSGAALAEPSVRLPDGVAVFSSAVAATALAACMSTQAAMAWVEGQDVGKCHPAGERRASSR